MANLVRAACLTGYAEVARRAGLNTERMLLDAGLDPGVLSQPDLMVPADRVRRLLAASASRTEDEAFSLRMAMTRRLSNLGPVGMVMRDQPTVREALQVLVRYHAALSGALVMRLEERDGLVWVREELLHTGKAPPTRQSMELAMGVLFVLMRQLLGDRWQPQRVCFAHAAPGNATLHLQLFGPQVVFGHEFNGIACLAGEIDACNHGADPQMAQYAQRLLDVTPVACETSTVDEVRRAIVQLLPSGRCNIEQISAHMGLTPRTVQRRLAEQGLNFSGLVNDLRVELAGRHVVQGHRPLTEVAALLGFAGLSGFSHWYQQQFNCCPSRTRTAQAASEGADLGEPGHLDPISAHTPWSRPLDGGNPPSADTANRRSFPCPASFASTKPVAPRCSSLSRPRSVRPAPARPACATPMSPSTSSTSTSALAATLCRS